MHIVIIEDETVIRQELKQLLENALYQVTAPEDFVDVASFVFEKQLAGSSTSGLESA
ncbi:hypothetical protein ACQRBN_12380 [Bariatricus sp. SGI.154]|uniref:hypothetical protein n=1 Tax=Bariatricus sp. SGI.154 TaxID=3420549 RepID=UPI003D022835